MSLLARLIYDHRPDPKKYIPFFIGDIVLGYLKPAFTDALLSQQEILQRLEKGVTFHSDLIEADRRSQAVAELLKKKKHLILGWRDELYPVVQQYGDRPHFLIERGAAMHFAFLTFAVNLIGYVEKPDGLHFWVGRRANTKHLAPGKLDVMAGGGLPHGLSIRDNLIKEAKEEAGVPFDLASQARAVGDVSFALETGPYLRREVQFNYALALPGDFTPIPVDGEVEEFMLLHWRELLEQLRESDDFIIDTVYVFLDFFIQQGIIAPSEPGFDKILALLHQPTDL